MTFQIKKTDKTGPDVSEMILGHNVEMCLTTAHGFLSERLRNPKLIGPPHRMTGIAPEWQGESCGRTNYELTPGGGLLGSAAQLVSAKGKGGIHLHQNRLNVRAGEELELTFWARAWHAAVRVNVSLHPVSNRAPAYDRGSVVVDAPYYKQYTVPLTAKRDDEEARLEISLPDGGEIWFDQLHLRPQGQPLLCQELVDEMAKMRIPTLRFPGGIVVNCYNWKHGTGPVHLRPAKLEAAFHQDWELNYDFGLDEYLQLALDQGITPTLTLNIGTGTPEEAAAFAAYCAAWYANAGAELPMIYWHIANHPYHNTTAHMTPAMYVEILKTFVPLVEENYPKCRIVAVMSRAALVGDGAPKEWKEALFTVADLIDVVEFQDYGSCDPFGEAGPQLEALAGKLAAFESNTSAFIAECRSRDVSWNVGIAEWNWWLQASHWDGRAFEEPPTVLHGLFIAGMIHRYAALAPDFEVAHFYNLVNCMGILNHRDAGVEVTDSVHVFNLYRPALPGTFLPIELVDATENVDVVCLRGNGADWLFIVNRTLADLPGVALEGVAIDGAAGDGLVGTTTVGNFEPREFDCTEAQIDVPALSILRLRLPH